MGKQSWTDKPVSSNITLERVKAEELPKLLGRHVSLDKKVADLLQTGKPPAVVWLWGIDNLIVIKLPEKFKEAFEIEAEIEGTSTGYYDPGSWEGRPEDAYPPESEDEREIISITFVIYDEDMEEMGKWKPEDLTAFEPFEKQLYDEEIDLSDW